VLKDADGTFWVASEDGMVTFVPEITAVDRPDPGPRIVAFRTLRHDPADPTTLSDNYIRNAIFDHRGQIWAATQGGLDVIDTKTGAVVRHRHNRAIPTVLAPVSSTGCSKTAPGRSGVGTLNAGVCRLRDESKPFVNYRPPVANDRPAGSDTVNSLCFDPAGRMWVATQGGTACLRRTRMGPLRHDPQDRARSAAIA